MSLGQPGPALIGPYVPGQQAPGPLEWALIVMACSPIPIPARE